MTELLTSIGSVATTVLGLVADFFGLVVSEPILLIPFSLSVLGGVVWLARKIKRTVR